MSLRGCGTSTVKPTVPIACAVNPEEVVLLLTDEYSRMAETYDRIVTPHFAPIAERVLALAAPKSGEMFLDLGTGTGLLACMIAPKVLPRPMVAIDLADGAIAAATYRAAGLGVKSVRFEMLDVRNIVYRGGLFDGVASNLGVPAIGYDRCFTEVARVLNPAGRFVFSEWGDMSDSAFDVFLAALDRHRVRDPPKKLSEIRAASEYFRTSQGYKDLRNPAVVKTALAKAGFRKVAVRTETISAVFDPPESFVDFRLAWGANEAEVAAMDTETRKAFLEDAGAELRARAGGARLEEDWLIHFYEARPQ
ncbi:MAG: methyltransferase domain-containing protein [Methanobacteriota archaeon]|nr:MAG: methyltransferase domain-containing protein [Euryarchaeota archaeon]